MLYQWPRPDGLPLGDAAWSSATRMLNSFRMHWDLAAGWWPTRDVSYRKSGGEWLPQHRIRRDRYVDHLCRAILGRGSDSRILGSVVAARRIKENGNRGLDHGWGNMMLVMGGGVKGGRYYGSWPGLGTDADDDLQVTTDYRNVFGEIVARRFPDRSLAQVFPGLSYSPVGLMN